MPEASAPIDVEASPNSAPSLAWFSEQLEEGALGSAGRVKRSRLGGNRATQAHARMNAARFVLSRVGPLTRPDSSNSWPFAGDWSQRAFLCNSQRREMGSNGVGDIARSQMRIVLLRHSSVGVAELFGNDTHRNAAHGQC